MVTKPEGTLDLVAAFLLESKVCLKTGAKALLEQMPWAKDFMLRHTHAVNNRYVYLLLFMRRYWMYVEARIKIVLNRVDKTRYTKLGVNTFFNCIINR